MGRPSWRSTTTASRSRPSTAAPRESSCRISTSGRAPSGCAACDSWTRTVPDSGSRSATTTTGIHGRKSAIAAISARPALEWQIATVKAIRQETPKVKSFTLALPKRIPHRAGQHYDIRLTAEDGYRAQRSYSIASEPQREGEIDLTVELIENGEVSTFLHQSAVAGDRLEVRGPIGGDLLGGAGPGGPPLVLPRGPRGGPFVSVLRYRPAAPADGP